MTRAQSLTGTATRPTKDINDYSSIATRRLLLITTTVLATLAVLVTVTAFMTPKYTASTTLRLETVTSGAINWVNFNIEYTDRLMNTYLQLAESPAVATALAQRVGLAEAPKVSAEILANTELLSLTAKSENPVQAAQIANTLAAILIEQSQVNLQDARTNLSGSLEPQLRQIEAEVRLAEQTLLNTPARLGNQSNPAAELAQQRLQDAQRRYETLLSQFEEARATQLLRNPPALTTVSAASAPLKPSEPNLLILYPLGLLLGLMGGIGLAFMSENLNTAVRSKEQVESLTRLPVVGEVPKLAGPWGRNSFPTNAFHTLRGNIMSRSRQQLDMLAVTSAEQGEGKSLVAAYLAESMAQSGKSVLLIDGHLQSPSVHDIFNLENSTGLADILSHTQTLGRAVQSVQHSNLNVLSTGYVDDSSWRLFSSSRLLDVLQQAKQKFDIVVIDMPSILATSDALPMAQASDAVLLVTEHGRTEEQFVSSAAQKLKAAGASVMGIILNGTNVEHY